MSLTRLIVVVIIMIFRKSKNGKIVYPLELARGKKLDANEADAVLNELGQKLNSDGMANFIKAPGKGRVLIIDPKENIHRWIGLDKISVVELWTNLLDGESIRSLHSSEKKLKNVKEEKKMMSFIILALLYINNGIDEKLNPTSNLKLAINRSDEWPEPRYEDLPIMLFFEKQEEIIKKRDIFSTPSLLSSVKVISTRSLSPLASISMDSDDNWSDDYPQ